MSGLGRLVAEGERYVVIDDVLDEGEFRLLWNYTQNENYKYLNTTNWDKVFRLHDGSGLQGPVYYSESAGVHLRHNVCPTGRGIDIIINKIQVNAGAISRYAGVPGDDWDYFTASPFIYPGGSQLSWHDDGSGRSGAYSFYTHPDWNVQWGGELFLLDRSASSLLAEIGQSHPSLVELYCGSHLDNSLENALLMEHGHGRFVFPKPNRLVVIRGDTYHSIRRVEASAGHHARCSVAGFFMAAH